MGRRYDELEAKYAGKYPRMPAEWFVEPMQHVLGYVYSWTESDYMDMVEALGMLYRAREDAQTVLDSVMCGHALYWTNRVPRPRHGICYELQSQRTVHMLTEVAERWPHARRSSAGTLCDYYCTVNDYEHYWEGENFYVRTLLLREFLKVLDMAINEVPNAE